MARSGYSGLQSVVGSLAVQRLLPPQEGITWVARPDRPAGFVCPAYVDRLLRGRHDKFPQPRKGT